MEGLEGRRRVEGKMGGVEGWRRIEGWMEGVEGRGRVEGKMEGVEVSRRVGQGLQVAGALVYFSIIMKNSMQKQSHLNE